MKLIGLAGLAGSGKDTVAEMILDTHRGTQIAFADPLKRAAMDIFGLTERQLTNRELKERPDPYWGLSPRQILQRLGTECIREQFGCDTWLKRAALELTRIRERILLEPWLVVVSDVRFPDEARWVRDQGGLVVYITRPGITPVSAHSSEQGLPIDLIDIHVDNDAGLDGLLALVESGLPGWLERATDIRGQA